MLPKLGLLNMILRAYDEGAAPDILFVPTFIGYDQVLEEKAYLQELEGGKKKRNRWASWSMPENSSRNATAGLISSSANPFP